MLGGLKLLLGSLAAPSRRPASSACRACYDARARRRRRSQPSLPAQVLGALHELLRGLHRAEREPASRLGAEQPASSLRRPAHRPDAPRVPALRRGSRPYPVAHGRRRAELYDHGYSVRGLLRAAAEDAALNPDTMDERLGGWGRLLALFRLIHKGRRLGLHPGPRRQAVRSRRLPLPRGRATRRGDPAARRWPVSDGCLLRVLRRADGASTASASPTARSTSSRSARSTRP